MLDLTAELVAQAASSSLVVFCFCNLLIVIILWSPKPSSNFDERSEFHLAVVAHDSVIDEQRLNIEQPPEGEEMTPEVTKLCIYENLEKEGRSCNGKGEDDSQDDGESNSEEMMPEVTKLCIYENLEKEGRSCNGKGEDGSQDDGESNNEEMPPEVTKLCVYENLEREGGSSNGEGKDDGESNNEDDDDDDDEFRRRIEAFIDKVNREWKAEKLRTLKLCEQVDLLVSS